MNHIKASTQIVDNINKKIDVLKSEIETYEKVKRGIMVQSIMNMKFHKDSNITPTTILQYQFDKMSSMTFEDAVESEKNNKIISKIEELMKEYSDE